MRGARLVADTFAGRARAAQLALLDGVMGAVWAPGGTVRGAITFAVAQGRIVGIAITADPERLRRLNVVLL